MRTGLRGGAGAPRSAPHRASSARTSGRRSTAPSSARLTNLGDYVRPGTVVFRLVQDDPLKFRGEVPERDVPALKPGQAMRITVDPYPGESLRRHGRRAWARRPIRRRVRWRSRRWCRTTIAGCGPGSSGTAKSWSGRTSAPSPCRGPRSPRSPGVTKVFVVEEGVAQRARGDPRRRPGRRLGRDHAGRRARPAGRDQRTFAPRRRHAGHRARRRDAGRLSRALRRRLHPPPGASPPCWWRPLVVLGLFSLPLARRRPVPEHRLPDHHRHHHAEGRRRRGDGDRRHQGARGGHQHHRRHRRAAAARRARASRRSSSASSSRSRARSPRRTCATRWPSVLAQLPDRHRLADHRQVRRRRRARHERSRSRAAGACAR